MLVERRCDLPTLRSAAGGGSSIPVTISPGARMVSLETALEIVRIWLETPFEGGRHQRRIDLIDTAKPGPKKDKKM